MKKSDKDVLRFRVTEETEYNVYSKDKDGNLQLEENIICKDRPTIKDVQERYKNTPGREDVKIALIVKVKDRKRTYEIPKDMFMEHAVLVENDKEEEE